MQVKALNRRAQEKYAEFVYAIDAVAEALSSVDAVIGRVATRAPAAGWTVANRAELRAMRVRAFEELDSLRGKAKEYESELVSREWRL